MVLLLFKNSNNFLYKYNFFKSNFCKYVFLNNFLYSNWIMLYYNILYKKNLLNFTFLNYINLIESLFGCKPICKKILINSKYKDKKLIKFLKKKDFSLEFKFFIFLNLNTFKLICFLNIFFSLVTLYKNLNYYFKLKLSYPIIKLQYINSFILIYKCFNMHVFLNIFLDKYLENLCIVKCNLFINFFFYKINFIKNFNFLKNILN